MSRCSVCGNALTGRQRKFCTRKCKNSYTNYIHQSYLKQQERGRLRKQELIRLKGGACKFCGYHANTAALALHHEDPKQKSFDLDLRALSNRKWEAVLIEARLCILLCANCHAELHNPQSKLN